MSIRLNLDSGFQKMIKDIELSQNDVKRVANACIHESANVMQTELKSAIVGASPPLSGSLASQLPAPKVTASGDVFEAKVGYESTAYNPKNLSSYHKALFANYGTPYRRYHGKERKRGFIPKAKRRAKPRIKKAQETAFKKILARLK